MNYWGKVTNSLNNITGANATTNDLMNELKKNEKTIK